MKISSSLLNGALVLAIISLPFIAGLANAQEKQFTLNVNQADIQTIGEALGTLPFGKVAPLMQKLQAQINEQNKLAMPEATKPLNDATTKPVATPVPVPSEEKK